MQYSKFQCSTVQCSGCPAAGRCKSEREIVCRIHWQGWVSPYTTLAYAALQCKSVHFTEMYCTVQYSTVHSSIEVHLSIVECSTGEYFRVQYCGGEARILNPCLWSVRCLNICAAPGQDTLLHAALNCTLGTAPYLEYCTSLQST